MEELGKVTSRAVDKTLCSPVSKCQLETRNLWNYLLNECKMKSFTYKTLANFTLSKIISTVVMISQWQDFIHHSSMIS